MVCKNVDLTGIEESKRPVFFCSFGKDSSVVLHALKPWLDKIMVVFVDCGGLYPDIVEWAQNEGAKLPNFFHLHSPGNIWDAIKEQGWPTDIEVEELGELANIMALNPVCLTQRVRLWTKCTNDRVWLPGYVFCQMHKPDLFISGEKSMDRPYATDWAIRDMGAGKVLQPLMDWTDEDSWNYIDEYGIPLTKTFQGRQSDRRDCYVCFGHSLSMDRINYLKNEWPELYDKIFNEMGFKTLVHVMVHQLNKSFNIWSQVEKQL